MSCVAFDRKLSVSLGLALAAPVLTGSTARLSAFESRVLAAHNRERDAMGVPALVWDARLAQAARQWADHIARTGDLEHSPGDPSDLGEPGENLWAGTRSAYSPEEMVGLWIAEKSDFKAGSKFPFVSKSEDLEAVGHYTQLIWRKTMKVGCALSTGANEDILVCRYTVSGNVIGERVV